MYVIMQASLICTAIPIASLATSRKLGYDGVIVSSAMVGWDAIKSHS